MIATPETPSQNDIEVRNKYIIELTQRAESAEQRCAELGKEVSNIAEEGLNAIAQYMHAHNDATAKSSYEQLNAFKATLQSALARRQSEGEEA